MDTLQQLIDEREICQLLGRFGEVMDNKEWTAIGEVYAHDVSFNYGGGEQKGLDTILALTRRHLDVCAGSQHLIGTIRVQVEGDGATSRSYVQARHQGAGAKTHLFYDTSGEYTDRWERGEAGWRIVRRDARWFMNMGDPSVIGIEEKPPA
jgi:ketosteroid isomerase-like protein